MMRATVLALLVGSVTVAATSTTNTAAVTTTADVATTTAAAVTTTATPAGPGPTTAGATTTSTAAAATTAAGATTTAAGGATTIAAGATTTAAGGAATTTAAGGATTTAAGGATTTGAGATTTLPPGACFIKGNFTVLINRSLADINASAFTANPASIKAAHVALAKAFGISQKMVKIFSSKTLNSTNKSFVFEVVYGIEDLYCVAKPAADPATFMSTFNSALAQSGVCPLPAPNQGGCAGSPSFAAPAKMKAPGQTPVAPVDPCKPTPAPTPAPSSNPCAPIATDATCATYACPAPMALRLQPSSLNCASLVGGCNAATCCLTQAKLFSARGPSGAKENDSVFQRLGGNAPAIIGIPALLIAVAMFARSTQRRRRETREVAIPYGILPEGTLVEANGDEDAEQGLE